MALARSKAVAIVEPLADAAPVVRPWERRRPGLALPMARAAHEAPLRRCTYRKLSVLDGRGTTSSYAAECLYEGLEHPIPMGDLDRAWGICQGCTNSGIFRADED